MSMSKVQMSVEWIFGDMSAVGEMYIVGAILWNCFTCLYGNPTAEYFDVQRPVLEDYFR